ncbi:MAG: hypothetical protein ABI923_03340 [bacterium]
MLSKHRIRRALAASRRSLPYMVGGISVLLCLWYATEAMSLGLSQLYAARAVAHNDVSLATRAVVLAPSDPETYRARAAVLAGQRRFSEATVDLTQHWP